MEKWGDLFHAPVFWGVLYLLAIPGFALLFQAQPTGSFFHATLQHEPNVQEQLRTVLQKLWDESSHPGPKGDGECKSITPFVKSVTPNSLRIEGDDVSFSGSYVLGAWPSEYLVEPRIHFSLERDFDLPYRLPPGKGRGRIFKELRVEGIETSPWGRVASPILITRCMFPTFYDERLPQNVALLAVSAPLDQEIHELASDLRGVPHNKSGGFGRMLYLSASTITTTGFGDVVPLTGRARTFVTIESIVGLILVGFFLNAVARRGSHLR